MGCCAVTTSDGDANAAAVSAQCHGRWRSMTKGACAGAVFCPQATDDRNAAGQGQPQQRGRARGARAAGAEPEYGTVETRLAVARLDTQVSPLHLTPC